MSRNKIPTVDEYSHALATALPAFTPEEQRGALTLYRELAKGQPVDVAQFARALGVAPADARRFLDRESIKVFVYPDDQGRVLGFLGLAVQPMHHRFEVDGRTLWTWCAWDALFMPERLGKRARIISPDPETGAPVELIVTPAAIEAVQPENAVASFLLPDAWEISSAAQVIATACHFIFFFTSRASGERWVAKHPGTFLYSLGDAFELARRVNAQYFGPELARFASAAA